MLGATATHRPASVWSFSMQTLASCYVLTTPHMAKLIRSNNGIEILRAQDKFTISSRVIVSFLFGHNFPGVWRTGLPRNPTLHLGHRRGECNSLSKLSAGKSSNGIFIFHSGGTYCAGVPSFQRQPDFNQAEQQHVHPLRRDGLLADERSSCQFANRCLKHELPEKLWSA